MRETFTRVTRKGQITVPAEIRRILNLQVGDTVAISLDSGESPRATLRPVQSITDMTFGSIHGARDTQDDAHSRAAFTDAASERDRRTQEKPHA